MKIKTLTAIAGLSLIAACGGTRTVYVNTTDALNVNEGYEVVTTTDAPDTTPAPTLPPVAWTDEDEFLYDIETNYYGTIYVSDYEMISTGQLVCDSLLSGMSGEEVVWAVVQAGGDTEFVATVVASAVANFCPSQSYKFENL